MKLKDGLALLREYVNEVEPNESFMQQLADYDLDQLSKNAFGKWDCNSFESRCEMQVIWFESLIVINLTKTYSIWKRIPNIN